MCCSWDTNHVQWWNVFRTVLSYRDHLGPPSIDYILLDVTQFLWVTTYDSEQWSSALQLHIVFSAFLCVPLFLACSQPGDGHPHHRSARNGHRRSGEPVLGPLPAQREPAHHLRRRHVSPLGDDSVSARLRHDGLCRQVWEHQHCKWSVERRINRCVLIGRIIIKKYYLRYAVCKTTGE